MIIRPFEEKDKENVRFVCLNSEGPCKMSPDQQHYILTTYCNYYIEQEGRNCFVAADDDDNAIAYIICTENYDEYRKVFAKQNYGRQYRLGACRLVVCRARSPLRQRKHHPAAAPANAQPCTNRPKT